jgi:hypothetical protein
MQLKVDETSKWEEVVESVDKEHIPINCVKKIILKLQNGRQKTINLEVLKRNGLDLDEIELVISRTISDLRRNVINIDFVIDVTSVAKHVQPITNKILSNL